jgi:hypothetical protein
LTIKKEKQRLEDLRSAFAEKRDRLGESQRLFGEFPPASLSVDSVEYGADNVAGISIPVLGEIRLSNPPIRRCLTRPGCPGDGKPPESCFALVSISMWPKGESSFWNMPGRKQHRR